MAKLGLKEVVLGAIGGVGGTVCYLLGGFDVNIKVLGGFMLADIVTGVVDAAILKKSPKTETGGLSSKYSLRGFLKKIYAFIGIGVCVGVDTLFNTETFFRNAAIFYLIGNELISITENLGVMDLKIPVLSDAVDLVRKRSQQKAEEKKDDVQ